MKKNTTIINFLLFIVIATLGSCSKSADVEVTPPVVTTTPVVVSAAGTTALTGGFLTSGDATAYGVCYSISNPQPTLSDLKTSETIAYASFSSNITGLAINTSYYLRAYATYAGITAYGNVIQFNTGADLSAIYGQVSTFAGDAVGGFRDGTGTDALFGSPMGIATDATGNIYVADSFNSAIRKITVDGKVTTIAGNGNLGFVDGNAETARFYSPSALAVAASGDVYVADRGNHAIRKITTGGVVTTIAGNGQSGYADGTGTAAKFNTPTGVAVDATNNVYVADNGNNVIRKITSAGVVTTIAGSRIAGYTNGIGAQASFNKPTGIALDATGNIYVTEPLNNTIRKVDANMLVTTFTGSPNSGAVASAWLGKPNAVSIDAGGNFWITDANGRVLKINTNGKLTVVAGKSGVTGVTNGAGNNALFNNPTGIAAGIGGNVYVADFGNNLIRKVN